MDSTRALGKGEANGECHINLCQISKTQLNAHVIAWANGQ